MEKNHTDYQTSEKVQIDYQIASIFERIGAFAIDSVIRIILFYIFYFVIIISVFGGSVLHDKYRNPVTTTILVIGIILYSLVVVFILFYQFIFELMWKGQSPGKKMLKIRIINDDGTYANFGSILLRNLFRIIDGLPFGYAAGIITLLINEKNKRIGDIVAGTIVVKEDTVKLPDLPDTIKLDCFDEIKNLSELFSKDEKEILKTYYESMTDIEEKALAEVENRLVKLITGKTSVELPHAVNKKDFILLVIKKILY